MSTTQRFCIDSQCQLQQKLIVNMMDQMEHENHKLINLEELREELNKPTHPIRAVLKLQSSEQILFDIDRQGDRITEIFQKYVEELVKGLKKSVITVAVETAEFKEFFEALNNQMRIWEKQDIISRYIQKANTQYIQGFCNLVTRIKQEPFKILEDLEIEISSICKKEQSPTPKKKRKSTNNERSSSYKKFKTTTKIEIDLIKQLQQEKDTNDLEVDLLGQMINKQDLRMPNEIFKTLRIYRNLQSLKLILSSTNLSDLSELSNTLKLFTELTSLSIALGNTKVQKVTDLGRSIGVLKNLERFELNLWSSNVTDVDGIGMGIAQVKGLRSLELILGNIFLSDVKELGKGISENKDLSEFKLNLSFSKVSDITELGWAIYTLRNVKDFELNLENTLVDVKINKQYLLVTHFINEWRQLNRNQRAQ